MAVAGFSEAFEHGAAAGGVEQFGEVFFFDFDTAEVAVVPGAVLVEAEVFEEFFGAFDAGHFFDVYADAFGES